MGHCISGEKKRLNLGQQATVSRLAPRCHVGFYKPRFRLAIYGQNSTTVCCETSNRGKYGLLFAGLLAYHAGIQAVFLKQFVVGAALYNAVLVND